MDNIHEPTTRNVAGNHREHAKRTGDIMVWIITQSKQAAELALVSLLLSVIAYGR